MRQALGPGALGRPRGSGGEGGGRGDRDGEKKKLQASGKKINK